MDIAGRAANESGLFDDTLTEGHLHLVSLRMQVIFRSPYIDTAEISAHARMPACQL